MDSGPKQENGVFGRRYNFELEKEFDSSFAINVVKTNRLVRWSHDRNTRTTTTEGYFECKTAMNKATRKTEIQAGGWGE
jgi:hypothetical protein